MGGPKLDVSGGSRGSCAPSKDGERFFAGNGVSSDGGGRPSEGNEASSDGNNVLSDGDEASSEGSFRRHGTGNAASTLRKTMWLPPDSLATPGYFEMRTMRPAASSK